MSTSVVFLESPYSGNVDRNLRYAQLAIMDAAVVHGDSPTASHTQMTQHPRAKHFFVSDYDVKWDVLTRDSAIALSQALRHKCDKTVFYIDLGWSNGMNAAREYCVQNRLPFEVRTLQPDKLFKKAPQMLTLEFIRAILTDNYQHYLENADASVV